VLTFDDDLTLLHLMSIKFFAFSSENELDTA
jgi:hypothetical protein